MKAECAGKNKLSGTQLFETDRILTPGVQFLEDAGNSVGVDESLFQEMDDLEPESDEYPSNSQTAGPESDFTG